MASAALVGNDLSNADPTPSFSEIRASSIPLASHNLHEAKRRNLVDESLSHVKKLRVAEDSNSHTEYEVDYASDIFLPFHFCGSQCDPASFGLVTECNEMQSDTDSSEELRELEERTQDAAEINSVNERLSVLQHLLPHGLELEEDEILKVAVEYVKELEREIQTFDVLSKDWYTPKQGTDDTPLQKRGLCIVPLSTLAQAL